MWLFLWNPGRYQSFGGTHLQLSLVEVALYAVVGFEGRAVRAVVSSADEVVLHASGLSASFLPVLSFTPLPVILDEYL